MRAGARGRGPRPYRCEFGAEFFGGTGAFFDVDRITFDSYREVRPDALTG